MSRIRSVLLALLISSLSALACSFGNASIVTITPPACIAAPAGLLSWWPGEGNADDIRGGNDGILIGGAGFAVGLVGQAFRFDRTSMASAPTDGLPIASNDRTLELWVQVNAFADGEAFFAGYGDFGSESRTYHLGAASGTLFFSQWGQAIFGPDLETGRWYHVAVTNTGPRVTLYLDGEVVGSGDMAIGTPGDTELLIGGLPDELSKRTDGLVDEVRVYNRALSSAEIWAIYQAGSDGMCPDGG